jgi:translation initiation factor IF-2
MESASYVLSDESRILAGILLLSLVTVETGGLYMLKIVRGAADVTPFQEKFARAGHAHAGVLLVLALLCQVLADTLSKLSDEKTKIKIIHSAVGAINESDVLLAAASNAIIIGFNVRPDRNAADVGEREKVDIRLHSVIYNVTDEIKKAMAGMLAPTFKEQRMGSAQVRDTFKVPKVGTIAGCMVLDGRISRSGDAQARLLRDNVVVWEGKLASLRRFKDDVSEVKAGFECGIGLQNYNDLKVGDVIEVFTMERVAVPV